MINLRVFVHPSLILHGDKVQSSALKFTHYLVLNTKCWQVLQPTAPVVQVPADGFGTAGNVAAKVQISESCFVPFKPLEEEEWKAGVWGEGEEEL